MKKPKNTNLTKELIGQKKVTGRKSKEILTPFEDFLDLQSLVSYEIRGRKVGAFLSKRNETRPFCLTFGFETKGIHTTMSATELDVLFKDLEAGLRDLIQEESMLVCLNAQKSPQERIKDLDNLIEKADSLEIKFLLMGEKATTQALADQGQREPKKIYIFCTYHERLNANSQLDWLDKGLLKLEKYWYQLKNKEIQYKKVNLYKLLREAFVDGFQVWEQFLSAKLGLKIKALKAEELWHYVWEKFNDTPAIDIPQKLIFTSSGVEEIINSNLHLTTLLTRGGVPKLDREWVQVNGKYVGILSFLDKPGGWSDRLSQLHYLWQVTAKDLVTETEIICQISPGNTSMMRLLMQRLTKQNLLATGKASSSGTIDVNSSIKTKEAVAAQESLYSGEIPVNTSVVFLVYRRSLERLTEACRYLEQCFHRPAWVARERDIAWKYWLQTLPFNTENLLSVPFANKRQVYPSFVSLRDQVRNKHSYPAYPEE